MSCPMTFTRFSACRATPPHHLRWDKKARGGRSQRVRFCHCSLKGSSKVFFLGESGLCYWEGSGYISQGLLFFPCPHQEGIFFGSPLWEPGRVLGNKDHGRVGPHPHPLKTGLQEFLTLKLVHSPPPASHQKYQLKYAYLFMAPLVSALDKQILTVTVSLFLFLYLNQRLNILGIAGIHGTCCIFLFSCGSKNNVCSKCSVVVFLVFQRYRNRCLEKYIWSHSLPPFSISTPSP